MQKLIPHLLSVFLFGVVGAAGCADSLSAHKQAETSAYGHPYFMDSCVWVSVSTGNTRQDILAEFARTEAEQSQGMMYRTNLPDQAAMLFDMQGRQNVVFWMKNTPSSLDIAFFDMQGTLVSLQTSTSPFSLDYIGPDPEVSVSFALEMTAGRAQRIGLEPGLSSLEISKIVDCPANLH